MYKFKSRGISVCLFVCTYHVKNIVYIQLHLIAMKTDAFMLCFDEIVPYGPSNVASWMKNITFNLTFVWLAFKAAVLQNILKNH